MPVKKVKKKSVKRRASIFSLKRKLWKIFSEYIRLRDSDEKGYVKCCTCSNLYYWKDSKGRAQAGHFIPAKGSPSILFDEVNVNHQCSKCNGNQGEQYLYALFLIDKYGQKEVDRLFELKGKPFKFTKEWLEEKLKFYTKKVADMKIEKKIK